MANSGDQLAIRVLVLAPTARDADISASLLHDCHIPHCICRSLHDLTIEVERGAGALLLTEEALTGPNMERLLQVLGWQPAWSELPAIVLMRGGYQSVAATHVLQRLGNVMILDRPASRRSIASAVRAAIRSRNRQYQMRANIEQIQRGEEQRARLLESERAARKQAEQANHIKDEFLATLSHELRTPMTAILGWAQMLRRSQLGTEAASAPVSQLQQGLEVIERNARLQSEIIQDLLDMSRIISGKVRLDIQTVRPSAVVQAAVDSIRPSADVKGVRLEVICDERCGDIRGDPNRLQQVFYNLLTNAVKFTPKGGRIQVVCQSANSRVEISVSDTGMGIKPEFLPYVFDRFRQQDASTTRAFGGLGLGLAIVKQLVELHGGSVHVTSAGDGRGATFTIHLPISIVVLPAAENVQPAGWRRREVHAQDGAHVDDSNQLAGITVLIVDDEPDARELLKNLLESTGAKTILAATAPEAIELSGRHQPDVLLSDIGMPEMDGYTLIRRLRQLPKDRGGSIPAIALTAFARSEDRTRSMVAGFQMHLSKPIERAELLATIKSVVQGVTPHANAAAESVIGA